MSNIADGVALPEVVLLLGDFRGAQNILKFSGNARYEYVPPIDPTFAWLGDRRERPDGPILCLSFGRHIYSPEGWVIGSANDVDKADLQVAENNTDGVSRRHFRVDIDPLSHKPRLTVLGQMLRVGPPDAPLLRVAKNSSIVIMEPLTIDLGKVKFQAWQPKLTHEEAELYQRKALWFSDEALAAFPRYFPSLSSGSQTITHETHVGTDGSIYIEQEVVGKGMSATVMRVMKQGSPIGSGFVAKEPFYKHSDNSGTLQNKWEETRLEYEKLIRLSHPHIVEAYDIATARDEKLTPWLIMEYLPGTLEPKSVNVNDTHLIAVQIFSALAHIHAEHIIHGDVKPSNILIRHGPPLTAKLGDFGIARHLYEDNWPAIIGTPLYMPPELREKFSTYNSMADIFSLGMVLLQCFLSSDTVIDSATRYNLSSSAQHREWMAEVIVPLIEEAPKTYQVLLRGTLRRDPAKRWSALQCLEWLSHRDSPPQELQGSAPSSGQSHDESPHSGVEAEQGVTGKKRPASLLVSGRTAVGVASPVRGSTNPLTSESASTLPRDAPYAGSRTPNASFAEPVLSSDAPTPGHDDEGYAATTHDEQHPPFFSRSDIEEDWRTSID